MLFDASIAVDSLYGSTSHMPPLAIAICWVLCLSHGHLIDKSQDHFLLKVHNNNNNNNNNSQNNNNNNCIFIRRGISRCMPGITESISLPGLLFWLPHMITINLPETNIHNDNPNNNITHESIQSSMKMKNVIIKLHDGGCFLGINVSNILYVLIGSAIHYISDLALGNSNSIYGGETMKICLRNLIIVPLHMMFEMCFNLSIFCDSLSHQTSSINYSLNQALIKYEKLFSIWLSLETNLNDFIQSFPQHFFTLLSNGHFRYSHDIIDIIEIKETIDHLSISYLFLHRFVEINQMKNSNSTQSCLSDYFSLISLNFNVTWWCMINNIFLLLLPSLTENLQPQDLSNYFNVLQTLFSTNMLNSMMFLFLKLKDSSLSIFSQLISQTNLIIIEGNNLGITLSLYLDILIKFVYVNEKYSTMISDNQLEILLSNYLSIFFTHLSNLNIEKMLVNEKFTINSEEINQRLFKLCQYYQLYQ